MPLCVRLCLNIDGHVKIRSEWLNKDEMNASSPQLYLYMKALSPILSILGDNNWMASKEGVLVDFPSMSCHK